VAAADPRSNFDGGCVRERSRDDHWLDDWNWAIWFHAAQPDGLGRADTGLFVDGNYRRITCTRLGPTECEEVECGGSTGALCPFNRGPFKQKREAILAEVGHTHLATVYWPGDKGPWHTTYDKKPLNGQVTRWQVWIGEDGARRRILG